MIEIANIAKLKGTGPVAFIETFLTHQGTPFKLYPFQKDIANKTDLMHDRTVLKKGRQVGGSILIAALCVYNVCVHDYATFIILSRTKDQANLISTYIRSFIAESPILKHLIDHNRTNTLDLYLVNKSKVITRSTGMVKADTLRGHSIQGKGCLVFDESAYLDADSIRNCYPLATGGAGIVHCSTPKNVTGAFYDAWVNPRFKKFHVPSHMSPRVTAEEIEFYREDFSPSKFAQEILAEFAQGEDCVFNADDIAAAIDPTLPVWGQPMIGDPDRNYIYSLDVSRIGRDRWALTIGSKEEPMRVVAYHSWAGTLHKDEPLEECDLTDNADRILEDIHRFHKHKHFHCVHFFCDTTSNEYFAYTLEKKFGFHVEHVVWGASKKERMVQHLESCIRSRKIKIPDSDVMRRELLSFGYDYKRLADHETRKLYRGDGDDDFVSSLCMLSLAISLRQQEYKDRLIWR